MYTREKPLLEKISKMRLEYEQLQDAMKAMQVENKTLKEQLKMCQTNGTGDGRLKQHITMLQDEVQYLTQINNA